MEGSESVKEGVLLYQKDLDFALRNLDFNSRQLITNHEAQNPKLFTS
jgi:hypothetical protein